MPMFRITLLGLLITGCTVSGDGYNPPPIKPEGDAPFKLTDPKSVLEVTDGDTIVVDLDGTEEWVRFKGIDTPELRPLPPGTPPEPFAEEARDYVLHNIGTDIDLEFDSHCLDPPECRDSTPRQRLLAYIRLADGTDLGARLLEQGLAEGFIYAGEEFDRKDAYLAIETQAKAAGVGQWQ